MAKSLIYLASASPRRRELLQQIGVDHVTMVADIDETPHSGEAAEVYVIRMALAKARTVAARLVKSAALPVLGSDTAVVVDGEILGKPVGEAEGLAMLARLSGRSHQVLTSVALVEGEHEATRLSVSHVTFRPTSAAERLAYWQTGESADKAGAYAIQGRAAVFIEHLEGSFSGVMGLPLYETWDLLNDFEVPLNGVWTKS